jgi:hypothetical protein
MDIQQIGLISIIVIIISIIIILIFRSRNNKHKKIKDTFENKAKQIKYFGAHYCPYSNKESMPYKVMQDLEEKYKENVEIQYYWIDDDGGEAGKEYNIEYVPAILNSQNEEVVLGLPEGTSPENKTNDELKELLLTNVYNKLT